MKNSGLILTLMLTQFTLFAQDLIPDATHAILKVNVMDPEGNPSEGEIITFVGENDLKSYEGITNQDGKFEILIPKGQKYAVKYRNFGYDHQYATHEIPDYDGPLVSKINIKYQLPTKTVLQDLEFEPDGFSLLKRKTYPNLEKLASLLQVKTNLNIRLSSHCGHEFSSDTALEITRKRANSIKKYLVSRHKIEPERLVATGYGSKFPMASNETAAGRRKNNRVEVEILK